MTAFYRKKGSNRTRWHGDEVSFSSKGRAAQLQPEEHSSKSTQQCPGHTTRMAIDMLCCRLAGVLCRAAEEASMLEQSGGICLSPRAHHSESHLSHLNLSLFTCQFLLPRSPLRGCRGNESRVLGPGSACRFDQGSQKQSGTLNSRVIFNSAGS